MTFYLSTGVELFLLASWTCPCVHPFVYAFFQSMCVIEASSTYVWCRYHAPEVLQGMRDLAVAKERLALACDRALKTWMGQIAGNYTLMKAAI